LELNKLFHLDIPGFKWDTREWVIGEIEDNNYFVFEKGGETTGALCINVDDCDAYVEAIAVRGNLHKTGVGRKLISFAKKYAANEGKSKLRVESFCEYGVDGFYEKLGFVSGDETETFEGKSYDHFSLNV